MKDHMTEVVRKVVPLPVHMQNYNKYFCKPEGLETCLFRYHFKTGRILEHVTHNVLIHGSLSTYHRVEGTGFLLRGRPQDQEYTEEGYRLHIFDEADPENPELTKVGRVVSLIREAALNYEWGGDEDSEGSLQPGPVDFEKLERRIVCILEDREYQPPAEPTKESPSDPSHKWVDVMDPSLNKD